MHLSDFNYHLPERSIAQTAVEPRDHSRLMVIDRQTDEISHKHFFDLVDILTDQDVLVCNNTRVIPARLYAQKSGQSSHIEIFLHQPFSDTAWKCLAKPGRKLKIGDQITFFDTHKSLSRYTGKIKEKHEDGEIIIDFVDGMGEVFSHQAFQLFLSSCGNTPLPPYIHETADADRYQTVYAENEGSVAAPTAGLHFTPELITQLQEKGIAFYFVELQVGLGTFSPVKTENIADHMMHSERFFLSQETADKLNEAKNSGKRIIAVGTTTVRVLESCTNESGKLEAQSGETNIFIFPGYTFQYVDALITNFHLPKSTLLMLISALYDREKILDAYKTAIDEGYRFYSFGDAMFLD